MMMWVLVFVALGVGLLIGRAGRWARMRAIEDRLRAIALDCRIAQDMGDPVPPEWVADQIDWAVAEDFR